MAQHRDYIKRDITTEASGKHFTAAGHSASDMAGMVLEKVASSDPHILAVRERHCTTSPNSTLTGQD